MEWTLRRWDQQENLDELNGELTKVDNWGSRRWNVNRHGQTFAKIEGPINFPMGSPFSEARRSIDELPHLENIPHSFSIAAKEVSVAEYKKFTDDARYHTFAIPAKEFDLQPDHPALSVNWFARGLL